MWLKLGLPTIAGNRPPKKAIKWKLSVDSIHIRSLIEPGDWRSQTFLLTETFRRALNVNQWQQVYLLLLERQHKNNCSSLTAPAVYKILSSVLASGRLIIQGNWALYLSDAFVLVFSSCFTSASLKDQIHPQVGCDSFCSQEVKNENFKVALQKIRFPIDAHMKRTKTLDNNCRSSDCLCTGSSRNGDFVFQRIDGSAVLNMFIFSVKYKLLLLDL